MLPLLLHKCWFSNLVCNIAASCPFAPPKAKRKKKKIILGLILWPNTCSAGREGQCEHGFVEGGTAGFSSCRMLALLFGTGQLTTVASTCIFCWWEPWREKQSDVDIPFWSASLLKPTKWINGSGVFFPLSFAWFQTVFLSHQWLQVWCEY